MSTPWLARTDGGSITTYAYSYDQTANDSNTPPHTTAGFLTVEMRDDSYNPSTGTGNKTISTSDLAGRTITSTDPDAGSSTFTYDPAGNVTRTVDAATNTINTAYDALNRPTGRWAGTAAEFNAAANTDKLASWTYDTVSNGLGMPASETSWQAGLQYTSSVTSYDTRFRITSSKVTIPGTFVTDPLAGDWKFQTVYDQAGHPTIVRTPTAPINPAVGGDPVYEGVTTNYDGLGNPDKLLPEQSSNTFNRYVYNSGFDDLGRVSQRTLALKNGSGNDALRRNYAYNTSTGQLDTIKAGWLSNGIGSSVSTYFQNDSITRDAIGRVTAITDNGYEPSGPSSVKECFLYDVHNRLIRAHSATINGTCAADTTTATVATSTLDAYDQTWTFDDLN